MFQNIPPTEQDEDEVLPALTFGEDHEPNEQDEKDMESLLEGWDKEYEETGEW